MILAFDAANTLIHKPKVISEIFDVLTENRIKISYYDIQYKHKLVSEMIDFPDITSESFYYKFNSDLLFSLGVIPEEKLLNTIFYRCKNLPWEPYTDTIALEDIPFKKIVISNFNIGLKPTLDSFFQNQFDDIYISEEELFRKPDIRFYKSIIEKLDVNKKEIIYFGDSLKLDIEPAEKIGLNAWLIDRNNFYPNFKKRITSLSEIKNII